MGPILPSYGKDSTFFPIFCQAFRRETALSNATEDMNSGCCGDSSLSSRFFPPSLLSHLKIDYERNYQKGHRSQMIAPDNFAVYLVRLGELIFVGNVAQTDPN